MDFAFSRVPQANLVQSDHLELEDHGVNPAFPGFQDQTVCQVIQDRRVLKVVRVRKVQLVPTVQSVIQVQSETRYVNMICCFEFLNLPQN